jgi:citrate lyase synthetase
LFEGSFSGLFTFGLDSIDYHLPHMIASVVRLRIGATELDRMESISAFQAESAVVIWARKFGLGHRYEVMRANLYYLVDFRGMKY